MSTPMMPTQHPAPTYAHLVSPMPFQKTAGQMVQSAQTLKDLKNQGAIKDSQLVSMDDSLKRGGSLLIASLATLGLKKKILGVPEFLGFLSWFAAMAVTPQISNSFIRAKTGINLNQQYMSSYGQRQDLFKDPHYLPLHILPDTTIKRVAKRLNIPDGPNQRKETEDRMRQISMQGRTWWMLIAGPATPVLSGLICDQLQQPATQALGQIKASWHQQAAQRAKTPEKAQAHLEQAVQKLTGEVPESSLTQWWKQFGQGIVKHTGLQKALSVSEVIDVPRHQLSHSLQQAFTQLSADDPKLIQTQHYLERQQQQLTQLEARVTALLDAAPKNIEASQLTSLRQNASAHLQNARATLTHYQDLTAAVQSNNIAKAKGLLTKPNLAELQRLIDTGYDHQARQLAGDSHQALKQAIGARRYGPANQILGAAPETHLMRALKDSALRRLWQRRMIGGLGGGMLVLTALYSQLVVGKTERKTS